MHQPATIAPPDCGRCGADADLVPVTDPGDSVLLCRLCVIALVGSTDAPIAVLVDVDGTWSDSRGKRTAPFDDDVPWSKRQETDRGRWGRR